jgi:tetratricopeptide (TPR) repeat protein
VTCLDEDSVLAFVDGSLGEPERLNVAGHLVVCAPCADLVAASAGGRPEALARHSLGDALSNGGGLTRGATVGRYVILELVGRGGMGEVYAAYDPRLDRKIALKLLHDTTTGRWVTEGASQERLLREAQSIARLSHPNVVVVHDAGAIDDQSHGVRVYLAMEFIEGQTLAAWLAEASRPWRAIRDVFMAAAEGLLAAHDAGLVHRDFKPQNVMVGRDGTVRVMDFGLARDTSEAADGNAAALDLAHSEAHPNADTVALTGTGVLLGTPLYMAPEQFLARATDARTDQFGFCVALYEALYGERPFGDASLSTLVGEVVAGRVRAPPQKARVPTFLRKVILRGLQVAPTDRFPSMRELIAALRTDPVRHRRTLAIGAALATAALMFVAGAQRFATRGNRMCSGGTDKLAGIWELDNRGPRRTAVHNTFLGTGSPIAEETWPRVSSLLDDYSKRWTGAYTDACEATHVRGDQSAEVLDLRMNCLEGLRGAFRALVDVLGDADSRTLLKAVAAATALAPIERCSDIAELRAVVPLPANAGARARVLELERQLAEVKALTDTGQWASARRKAGPLVDAARAVGYEPLLAETLEARAWLETQLADLPVSLKTLEETVNVALAAHRDDIAADSAAQLIAVNALLSRRKESERWEAMAKALLQRLGPGHDRILAWFYQDCAIALEHKGDFKASLADCERALSVKRSVLPPAHPDIGFSLFAISWLYDDMDEGQLALAAAEEALSIAQNAYGPRSPTVWAFLCARGRAFERLQRYNDAESDLRLSLALATTLLGSDDPWLSDSLTALGTTLVAEGKYREASSILEKAVRLRERMRPPAPTEDVAETRFALAQAHWPLNLDRAGAMTLAKAALDSYRNLPGYKKRAEEVNSWLVNKSTAGSQTARLELAARNAPKTRPQSAGAAPAGTVGSTDLRSQAP